MATRKKSYTQKCWKPAVLHTVSSLMLLASLIMLIIGIAKEDLEDGVDFDKGLVIAAIIVGALGFIGYMTSVIVLIVKKCYKVLGVQTLLNVFGIPA